MRAKFEEFRRDRSGSTAIEVALIAAGISVAVITLASHAGDDVKFMVDRLRDLVQTFNLHYTA